MKDAKEIATMQQLITTAPPNGRISLFEHRAYLPLLHVLVEERAGQRRFPSP
jgi:hypothetical protein